MMLEKMPGNVESIDETISTITSVMGAPTVNDDPDHRAKVLNALNEVHSGEKLSDWTRPHLMYEVENFVVNEFSTGAQIVEGTVKFIALGHKANFEVETLPETDPNVLSKIHKLIVDIEQMKVWNMFSISSGFAVALGLKKEDEAIISERAGRIEIKTATVTVYSDEYKRWRITFSLDGSEELFERWFEKKKGSDDITKVYGSSLSDIGDDPFRNKR